MSEGIDISRLKVPKTGAYKEPKSTSETSASANINWKELLSRDIQLFGRSILNDKTREEFYLELAILLEAGVDIKSALELIAEDQTKPALISLFSAINESIIKGETFSEAVKASAKFSTYEYFSIQIGEESGKIVQVLKQLALFYNKKVKQKRQILSALSYPIVVLCTAFGAVFFMITFVVPMFSGIFKRFGGDLPMVTKAVIAGSLILRLTLPFILTAIIITWVFLYSQRHTIWFKKHSTGLLLRIPLFGELIKKVYLSRFSYSMTLLTSSRIPILRAIGLIKEMIDFYPIEHSLTSIEEDILQGIPLHEGMAKHSIYPKRMVSLLKVGEEVNQLEQFFDKIAVQYNEEVEYQTSVISNVIEPVIIIFLGLIVGTILISMYLPLFKLKSSF